MTTNLRSVESSVSPAFSWSFDLQGISDMYRSYETTNLWFVIHFVVLSTLYIMQFVPTSCIVCPLCKCLCACNRDEDVPLFGALVRAASERYRHEGCSLPPTGLAIEQEIKGWKKLVVCPRSMLQFETAALKCSANAVSSLFSSCHGE